VNQLFVSSGPIATALFAAAIDTGRLGARPGRRILLVSDETAGAELAPPLPERADHAALYDRFDEVVSLNELLAPMHPQDWRPALEEQPMLERLLRRHWGLGDEPVEVIVETLETAPAQTLAEVFHDAPVTVCCGTLEVYGPVRALLPRGVGSRVERLLHLDLVPGLPPRLLSDYGVAPQIVAQDAFAKAFEEVKAGAETLLAGRLPAGADRAALIVGQCLTDLGPTGEQEERIHLEMLRGLVARGNRTVAFVPAPDGQTALAAALAAEAGRLGAELVTLDEPVPAEVWCALLRPEVAVGVFPPALVRVSHLLEVPVMTLGTVRVLERLNPYDNAARIPATVVDATFPRLTDEGDAIPPPIARHEIKSRLVPLLAAVTYCMQPGRYPEMRAATAEYVDALPPGPALRRYFRMQRLITLGLAQPPPPAPAEPVGTLQRVADVTRRLKGRLR